MGASKSVILILCMGVVSVAVMTVIGVRRPEIRVVLPYDRTNAVIYDNDDAADAYVGEYLMALASAGEINVRGIIVGSLWPTSTKEGSLQKHRQIVAKARRSGMGNIPDPVPGAFMALQTPASGEISDTVPIDTPGSRLIVEEAKAVSAEKPLLIVTGGQLTTVASAYLLDNSIADKVVVASVLGGHNNMKDYNGIMDGWAAYIVLQKLRYVQFPAGQSPADVPKDRFYELPETELRQWLIEKDEPSANLPGGKDHDGQPAISMMRPDYVIGAKRVSFSDWMDIPPKDWKPDGRVPAFQDDPGGKALVVTKANAAVATEEFWRALKNPAAWETKAKH